MAETRSGHAKLIFQPFLMSWNTELLCSFIEKKYILVPLIGQKRFYDLAKLSSFGVTS